MDNSWVLLDDWDITSKTAFFYNEADATLEGVGKIKDGRESIMYVAKIVKKISPESVPIETKVETID